jgi:hypothetical protein
MPTPNLFQVGVPWLFPLYSGLEISRGIRGDFLNLAGYGKSRICHPEPALFAGDGFAVCKKTKEKADSELRSKTEWGSE